MLERIQGKIKLNKFTKTTMPLQMNSMNHCLSMAYIFCLLLVALPSSSWKWLHVFFVKAVCKVLSQLRDIKKLLFWHLTMELCSCKRYCKNTAIWLLLNICKFNCYTLWFAGVQRSVPLWMLAMKFTYCYTYEQWDIESQ